MSALIFPLAILLVALVAAYFLRWRTRCPHRDPLCRHDKPCLLCYRDLYQDKVARREPDNRKAPHEL